MTTPEEDRETVEHVVARLRLPIPVGPLARLVASLEVAYGPDLFFRGENDSYTANWLIIFAEAQSVRT